MSMMTETLMLMRLKLDADWCNYIRRKPLDIPKLYASLSHFTKADNGSFDPWKGSFGIEFLLKVEKAGIHGAFLHHIFQYKEGFRAPLFHLVPTSVAGPSDSGYRAPKDIPKAVLTLACINRV